VVVTTGTSVQVLSATTGRMIGSVKPQHRVASPPNQFSALGDYTAGPAQVEDIQGGQVALVGYVVQLPGRGTTPPSLAVEVDAVDTSAKRLWEILAPLSAQPSILATTPTVNFVGSSGSDVVAVVGDSDDGYSTLAFDISRHKLLWQSLPFFAGAVAGSTVFGTIDSSAPSGLRTHGGIVGLHMAAVSLQTGKIKWRLSKSVLDANFQVGGPDTLMVEALSYLGEDATISLLHVATGQGHTLSSQPRAGEALPWTCQSDGDATVVCGGVVSPLAFALDGDTGKLLWLLPDPSENRIAPIVTAVYGGFVYGTTPSGPVVLDARTGKDVNDSPGVAPVALDAVVGVGNRDK
jgi:outer membrane protein assembly factor BamB